jgi:hypothetical protein
MSSTWLAFVETKKNPPNVSVGRVSWVEWSMPMAQPKLHDYQ